MSTKTLILPSTYPSHLSPSNLASHHRLRAKANITLHIVSLITSLTSISLFSAAIPRWNANFFHNSGPNRGDWTDGISLGPLCFAFAYHTIVLIYGLIRRQRRATGSSFSPSRRSLTIHTATSVLVMTSLAPCLFIAGYGSLFRFWQPAMRTQSGVVVCNLLNVFARGCEPVLYIVGSLQIAGIVFGALLWTLHLTLVLLSLRDLRRHKLVKQLQREKLAHYENAGWRRASDRQNLTARSSSGNPQVSHQTPRQHLDAPPQARLKTNSRPTSRPHSHENGVSPDAQRR
ncbi:hypothetical protein B0A52_10166 [Exophiala mesophila]|uniref:Uncharacterized protein n=1 Tax=Exophiala mesophila TaxID=212818 RepID=A0A438MTI3_EXOME|nr:hypothetical protein B0A52_10166 [Exophiala mesophila]